MSNRPLSLIVLSILLLTALLAACSPLGNSPDPAPASGTDEQPGVSTIELSTVFVPNVGQSDPGVLFRTLGSSGMLLFTGHEVVFPLPSPDLAAKLLRRLLSQGEYEPAGPPDSTSLRLCFEGANADAQVVGEEQLPGIVNYFIGNDPERWQADVPTYGSIVYERLYPGIDLLYEGHEGILKGTYVVAPGADPGDISWRYDGAAGIELAEGELLIKVAGSSETAALVERKPVAWQTVAGQRQYVKVRYVIHRDGSIGFALGRYDATQPLMIDPVLDYSTFFGGTGDDASFDTAVDSSDNLYVAGASDSQSPGNFDILVIKLDPSQEGFNQLIYATYIGGSDEEAAFGIEVDSSGNAYVAGYTESSNFPATVSAYQQNLAGNRDAVVVQLDATGTVNYASHLGGTAFDNAVQVAVGNTPLMYVVGYTESDNFPTSADAFQIDRFGPSDAFVSVVDPSLSGLASLVYSTYFGGYEDDEGSAIDVSDGIIYFAGQTRSYELWLQNPIQSFNQGGEEWGDAFIAKLDPAQTPTTQLLFATYLGGSDDEISGGIAAEDSSGNVLLVGSTKSADFPTTNGLPYAGGDYDAFLAKISTTYPTSLVLSRFVGGSGSDGLRGVVFEGPGPAYAAGGSEGVRELTVNSSGLVFVAGGTGSGDIPGCMQGTFSGGSPPGEGYRNLGPGDAFVGAFNAATGQMICGAYLGGSGDEAALGVARNMLACVFIAGATTSTDLDTQNPFQGTSMGNFDLFAACIPGLTQEAGTITIVKDADPADGTDFPFAGDLGSFTLDDAVPDDSDGFSDTRTFDKPAGSYWVQELAASGWALSDIGCTTNDTDDTTVINISSASVQIDLDYGEDVTCTFTNTFGYPIPIGGVVVPVNKLGLLAPWIGLATLVALAVLSVALIRRRGA